jgi:hypothetical protein
VIVYSISQEILILVWLIDVRRVTERVFGRNQSQDNPLVTASLWAMSGVGILLGAFTFVGGTVMQLYGLYRNCVCVAGIKYVFNYSGGVVDLATDSKQSRDSWAIWWRAGIAAIAFYSAILLWTSFHEMWMQEKCKKIIDFLDLAAKLRDEKGTELASVVSPQLPGYGDRNDEYKGSDDDDNGGDGDDGDTDANDQSELLRRPFTEQHRSVV